MCLFIPVLGYSQLQKKGLKTPFESPVAFSTFNSEGFYKIEEFLPKGYVKNASVDYTSYIQNCLDNNKKIILPDFPVLITGIYPPSNSIIYFQKNSKLVLEPTSKETYHIIGLHGVENVKIYNANLYGDRDQHKGTKGEWGFGIDIRKSSNIIIENSHIENTWGDGINITESSIGLVINKKSNINTNNISINNIYINNVRRNGISITGGTNVSVTNANINNVYGTMPQSGIDIEGYGNSTLKNILLNNININNAHIGIDFHLAAFSKKDNEKSVDVTINKLKVYNSNYGVYIAGFKDQKNSWKITGSFSLSNFETNNVTKPFGKVKTFNKYPKVTISNYNFIKQGKSFRNNEKLLLENVQDISGLKY